MSVLRLSDFGGIAPAVDSSRLPDALSQRANNVVFEGAQMRALMQDLEPGAFPAPPRSFGDTSKDVLATLPFTDLAGEKLLLQFHADYVPGLTINACLGQINNDEHARVYFTQRDGGLRVSRDGSTTTVSAGVPLPVTTPLATGSSISPQPIANISKSDSPVVSVNLLSPHGLSTGDTVELTITKLPGATDSEAGMLELSGRRFSIVVTSPTTFTLDDVSTANSIAWDQAKVSGTFIKVVASSDVEDRIYVYTFVNVWGEESAPSEPSNVIAAADGDTITVETRTYTFPAGFAELNQVRFYRSVTGATTATRMLFVGSVAAGPTGNVSFSDNVKDAALGEELITTGHVRPHESLRGLQPMPNGFLSGFVGNSLYFSEPYLPNAWPAANIKTTDQPIVGTAVFGNTLVVATRTSVFFATGSDPASITLQRAPIDAPCVKPECMVSVGYGVVYPTYDGLVFVGEGEARNITAGIFTKQQWANVMSLAHSAAWHDGRYYLLSRITGGTQYVFELGGESTRVSTFVMKDGTLDVGISHAFTWPFTDQFTLIYTGFGTDRRIHAAHASKMLTATWKSKLFKFNGEVNFAALQVVADYALTDGAVTVSLFPAGRDVAANREGVARSWTGEEAAVPFYTVSVNSPDPVRLPASVTSREWTVTLSFDHRAGNVTELTLVESMEELKGL